METKKNDTLILSTNIDQKDLPTLVERLNEERLGNILENYLNYYATGDSHTARAKKYDLQHFLEFLAGTAKDAERVLVSDWTLQATKDFVDYRLKLGESPATVNRRLATIKHFGRTLAERVHGFINPAREAKAPTLPITRPKGLSAEELELLQKAAKELTEESRNSFLAVRNRMLLELLIATGIRADEVRNILISQISEDCQWIRNVKTKGKKYRNVYVGTSIRTLLREYLESREEFLLEKYPLYSSISQSAKGKFPLFISFYQADVAVPDTFSLAPKTVWRIVAGFGTKAQAMSDMKFENLHPHKLRHTFAHGLLDSSQDLRLVAQALGHSDVRITMRYTERSDEELKNAIEQKLKIEVSKSN